MDRSAASISAALAGSWTTAASAVSRTSACGSGPAAAGHDRPPATNARRPRERARHLFREPRGVRMAGGDVHAQVEGACGRLGRAPGGELVARLLEHPAAERDDEPALLRDRDEVVRRHDAAGRVRPPEERLGPDDGAGLQVDDRLVVEDELLLDTCAP